MFSPVAGCADDRNDEAVTLLERGDDEAGEKALGEALALDPLHPEATYNDALQRWRSARSADDAVFRAVAYVHETSGKGERTGQLCAALAAERGDPGGAVELDLGTAHGWVLAVMPCRGGEMVLTAGEDGVLRAWQSRAGECLHRLLGHSGWITAVSATPDGRRALTASHDNTVRVWDLDAGSCTAVLGGHSKTVQAVRALGDDRAVSAATDGTARFWDLRTSECTRTVPISELFHSKIAVSEDGAVAAMTTGYPRVDVWDIESGYKSGVLESGGRYATSVAIAPDGRLLVVGSADGRVTVWELPSNQLFSELRGHLSEVTAAAIDPTEARAATGDARGFLRIWDLSTGRCLRTYHDSDERVDSITLSPGARRIFVGGHEGRVRVLRGGDHEKAPFARSPVCPPEQRAAEARRFEAAVGKVKQAWSAGDFTAALSAFREVRQAPSFARHPEIRNLWTALRPAARTGRLLDAWRETEIRIAPWTSAFLSSDGKYVYGIAPEGGNAAWECPHGIRSLTGLHGLPDIVAVASGASCLAASTKDGSLHVLRWNGPTTAFKASRPDSCLALTADGSRIVAGRGDTTVVVRDAGTGEVLRTLEWQHEGGICAVAVSADGRVIASASRDRVVIWDVPSGEPVRVLCEDAPSVALTENGAFALTGSADGWVRLWDLRTGLPWWAMRQSATSVQVAITPDGRVAAAIGRDLRLYEGFKGRETRVFEGYEGANLRVALAADGSRVASFGEDRAIVYRLDFELDSPGERADVPAAVVLPALPPAPEVPVPRAWLVEVQPDTGTRHLLGAVTTFGRVEGNTVVLPHGTVSSRHAVVRHHRGAFWLSDVQSMSGTYVNGAQGPVRHRLKAGDVVGLGQVHLRFETDAH